MDVIASTIARKALERRDCTTKRIHRARRNYPQRATTSTKRAHTHFSHMHVYPSTIYGYIAGFDVASVFSYVSYCEYVNKWSIGGKAAERRFFVETISKVTNETNKRVRAHLINCVLNGHRYIFITVLCYIGIVNIVVAVGIGVITAWGELKTMYLHFPVLVILYQIT